jgi:hypothetical protein
MLSKKPTKWGMEKEAVFSSFSNCSGFFSTLGSSSVGNNGLEREKSKGRTFQN